MLHEVEYDGRSVLHRGSLVEMAVPYGDPNPSYARKCAFDVGDYGLGFCANSLELGCDCLGHIHYFDGVLNNSKGEAYTVKKAICMHEIDDGILWKHLEYRNGHAESRRSRKLVLSSIATVVNYEYLFYWYLGQDGTIDFEIRLSGELSTNLLSEGEEEKPGWGVMVAPGVNAQVRVHLAGGGPCCPVTPTFSRTLAAPPIFCILAPARWGGGGGGGGGGGIRDSELHCLEQWWLWPAQRGWGVREAKGAGRALGQCTEAGWRTQRRGNSSAGEREGGGGGGGTSAHSLASVIATHKSACPCLCPCPLQVHQHMFCARLDLAVDGQSNTVTEVDVVAEAPGDSNPFNNAFGPQYKPLTTEKEAQRVSDPGKARAWLVQNPEVVNPISGQPVGYKLLPFTRGPAHPVLLTGEASAVTARGQFATKHLWVTPHSDEERWPAGDYTIQSSGGEGLPAWTANDRSVTNTDLVLWHSFGVVHVPRPEDFPVMPCEMTGFSLKPAGFFQGNPAIDLPPEQNAASKCCSHPDK